MIFIVKITMQVLECIASTELSYSLPTSLPYIVGRLVGSCRWKMVIHAMSMLIGRAAIS